MRTLVSVFLEKKAAFRRVGSTDICVKCLLTRGDGRTCVCPPKERFFLDLTKIDLKCGCVGKCTKNHTEFL